MAWTHQIARPCCGINQSTRSDGAIACGNSGGRAMHGKNRSGKGRTLQGIASFFCKWNAQGIKALSCKRDTDQATGCMCKEVDCFRRCELRCHAEISLVFTVLIIADQYHASGTQFAHGLNHSYSSSSYI